MNEDNILFATVVYTTSQIDGDKFINFSSHLSVKEPKTRNVREFDLPIYVTASDNNSFFERITNALSDIYLVDKDDVHVKFFKI